MTKKEIDKLVNDIVFDMWKQHYSYDTTIFYFSLNIGFKKTIKEYLKYGTTIDGYTFKKSDWEYNKKAICDFLRKEIKKHLLDLLKSKNHLEKEFLEKYIMEYKNEK